MEAISAGARADGVGIFYLETLLFEGIRKVYGGTLEVASAHFIGEYDIYVMAPCICLKCESTFEDRRGTKYCHKKVERNCLVCEKRFYFECGNYQPLTCSSPCTRIHSSNKKVQARTLLRKTSFWYLLDDEKHNLERFQDSTVKSEEIVWWKSPCGHSWKSSIKQVVYYKQTRCQICSGKKVTSGVNDFQTLRQDLMLEWHPSNVLDPSKLPEHSNKKAKWLCRKCGFSYEASLSKKSSGRGCPCCSGRTLVPGINDLLTRFPDVAKDWDEEKNYLAASNVMPGTMKQYWWICENGHSYSMSPNKKVAGRGCTECFKRSQQSSIEKSIVGFLKKEYPHEEILLSDRKVLKGKEIDIYLPRLKIGIEVNGEYWHSNSSIMRRNGKTAEEFHREKISLGRESGIDLLFLWESDWNLYRDEVMRDLKEVFEHSYIHYRFKRLNSKNDLIKTQFFPLEKIIYELRK